MEEVSFDSLPFLFSDSEHSLILEYKQKAIKREQELERSRREKLEQLRGLVRLKITNAETRKCNRETPPVRTTELIQAELHLYQGHKVSPTEEQHTRPPRLQTCRYGKHGLQTNTDRVLVETQNADTRNSIIEHSLVSRVSQKKQCVYVRVSAVAKGFLTRRLLSSEKVREVITTIKDIRAVLESIERSGDQQDSAFQSRVLVQLQVAKTKLYNIFFIIPMAQRMMYIAHSRQLRKAGKTRHNKPSTGQLSSATMKSLDRRKRSGLKDNTTAPSKTVQTPVNDEQ